MQRGTGFKTQYHDCVPYSWTTTSRGRDSSRFPMSAMRKGRKSVSPVLPSGQVPEALTTKRLRPAKFETFFENLSSLFSTY
ncbi:Uncharacterized protein APZ42_030103 [Daphnia magna]|uniref:Uncharacterized protein n=1 Tax=Daphnia magna TaxID=35525 RepID=A0A164P241_9CRUS|nr:Uncharacterized protein APZ42_030103 [Daphnia magna]